MPARSLIMLALMAAAPATAQTGGPTPEQRLERMEAESAIRRLLILYGTHLDARDFAAYAALFAPEGEWVGGFGHFRGPAAIQAMLEKAYGTAKPGPAERTSQHFLSEPLIEIEGDRAHAVSHYMLLNRSGDDRPLPLRSGRYEDDLVRIDGTWKIARRVTHGVIPYRDGHAPSAGQQEARPSAEARLQRVEDELAIRRVLADYAATLDGRDYAAYAALFTADGEWTGGGTTHKGPAAIEAMLARVLGPAGAPNSADFHIISNPQVTVLGEKAMATSRYLFVMRGKDGRPEPSLAGIYTDELARQDDGSWKIRRRIAADIMPSREEWARIIAERTGQ